MPYNNPPWHPMSKPIDLKHMGKLSEELGECVAIISRCIIQGIDELEPVTKKSNRIALQDEISDVMCNLALVIEHFNLDKEYISGRMDRKAPLLKSWHGELKTQ